MSNGYPKTRVLGNHSTTRVDDFKYQCSQTTFFLHNWNLRFEVTMHVSNKWLLFRFIVFLQIIVDLSYIILKPTRAHCH